MYKQHRRLCRRTAWRGVEELLPVYVVGQEKVHIVKYDPRRRTMSVM